VAASHILSTIVSLSMRTQTPGATADTVRREVVQYCRAHPTEAVDVRARQVLVAMATDAFSDDEAAIPRHFLRLVAILEGFASGGLAFLAAVESSAPDSSLPPSVLAYRALLARTVSRAGLISVLRERVTCRCLQAPAAQ